MILTTTQDEMRNIAADFLTPINKGILLEIGCSAGNFVSILKNKGIDTQKYIGIDILKNKIKEAKKEHPGVNFIHADICKEIEYLQKTEILVSFQALEHIGTVGGYEDVQIFTHLKPNTKIIISIPNSPFRKEHKRWFELDGWKNRYSKYINFDYEVTIQNPRKKDKRSFLFKGYKK